MAAIRKIAVRKPPSISESIDWAHTLLALGIEDLDSASAGDTLNVLLKYQSDIDKVATELSLDADAADSAAGAIAGIG